MSAVREEEDHVVAPSARDSWRNWLMTGIRQRPIYRRRVRGAHKGLKQMLVEGTTDGSDEGRRWKRFSSAMVRQAVDEAVSSLPPRQKQLIKLAYFSDLTNREIAQGLGITVGSVERGLREAIARVSEYVERGKGAGRRAIYAVGLFLGGRWLSDAVQQTSGPSTGQLVKAGALIVAAATAGTVLVAQPAAPPPPVHVESLSIPAITITSAQSYEILPQSAVQLPHATKAVVDIAKAKALGAGGVEVALPPVTLPPIKLPNHLDYAPPPSLPQLSIGHGLLGA